MRPRQRRSYIEKTAAHQRRHKPDYILLILSALLLVIGLIVVYAISPGLAAQNNVSNNYYVSKQFVAISLGLVAFGITSRLPTSIWQRIQWPLIIAAGVSSVAVRIVGEQVNGAYRWIQIGGMSFQPVELVKLALIIWLAGFLAARLKERDLEDYAKSLKPLGIVGAACIVVIAGLQSDLGSTGVIAAIVAIMLFVAGLPLKRVAVLAVVLIGVAGLFIASSEYRRDRFYTYLNPESDCQDAGYQTCQALIAVGSGGLTGRGLASSGQAFGYLPEAANDSIFAIMSEKFGFIGMSIILLLFAGLFSRLKRIIERAPDEQSRFIVVGVLAWLSTQAFMNVGAMIGLVPLKGITLPFISYGGTSVVFVAAAIGIVFEISRYTTYEISAGSEGSMHEGSTDWRRNRRPHYSTASRS